MKKHLVWALAWLSFSCGNPAADKSKGAASDAVGVAARGEPIVPPFEVKGEAEGLLLVWYDERGEAHSASSRAEIPEARRASVRVDALEVAPEQRLDPAYVYVTDLRKPGASGTFSVRKVERAAFESALASAAPTVDEQATATASSDVIIYGASWCGACKQAARYFTQKGVPFTEKDIEKEPGARSEMMSKAKAQGVRTGGIPVIDVKGTLLGGFNAERIEQLLASR